MTNGQPTDGAATAENELERRLEDEESGDYSDQDAASAPDDSADEDWEEVSAQASSDEDESSIVTPTSVSWSNDEVKRKVSELMNADICEQKCCSGQEGELQKFFLSYSRLSKEGRRVSVLTALSILKEVSVVGRHRGAGDRDRFSYYIPMVGRVCFQTFCAAYSVSTATVKRLRAQIKAGDFAPKMHGGVGNQNASIIDVVWLVDWFKAFAAQVAEVVSVRVRRQETVNGVTKRYYSPADFYLLPAYFTWESLHQELVAYIAENELQVREPALATMRQLLVKNCPNVRIRSARSNVCDVCAIYHSKMKSGAPADLTETFGKHTMAARRMRQEYQHDLAVADEDHAVLIMDFSQNLTLPSVSTTPSEWYFMSLWCVNMFGLYFVNDKTQYNYLYEERTAGKGSDEVVSMLHHFIRTNLLMHSYTKLTIYADNCVGQNKNNFVVKFLLALAHMGDFEDVALKFFIKGHTKNAVDRGFGHVRKKLGRADVYTMEQLLKVVSSASASSSVIHLTPELQVFKSYKIVLADVYKNIPAISKYQIFKMKDSEPGTVRCFVDPDGDPVVCDIRRRYDGIVTDDGRVRTVFQVHLDPLPIPATNTEKVLTMYTKVRQYVPEEFQDDPLYAAPTAEQEATAKKVKLARVEALKTAVSKVAAPKRPRSGGTRSDGAIPLDTVGQPPVAATQTPAQELQAHEKTGPASRKRARKDD